MTWKMILRLFNPALFDAIQSYAVTSDSQMPLAYQDIPGGRPLHNDWGIMSTNPVLMFLQPWQKIKRMDCAYRIPLPFKLVKGINTPAWRRWDTSYPQAPGVLLELRPDGPWAFTDECETGWSTWAAYINGAWRPCFTLYRGMWFGKRLSFYCGLKGDLTVAIDENGKPKSDLMAWFPEFSISYITP